MDLDLDKAHGYTARPLGMKAEIPVPAGRQPADRFDWGTECPANQEETTRSP
jgi:hypothetical protein